MEITLFRVDVHDDAVAKEPTQMTGHHCGPDAWRRQSGNEIRFAWFRLSLHQRKIAQRTDDKRFHAHNQINCNRWAFERNRWINFHWPQSNGHFIQFFIIIVINVFMFRDFIFLSITAWNDFFCRQLKIPPMFYDGETLKTIIGFLRFEFRRCCPRPKQSAILEYLSGCLRVRIARAFDVDEFCVLTNDCPSVRR